MRALLILFSIVFSFSTAFAKNIKLEWKAIPGAARYEVQIEQNGAEVARHQITGTVWKGALNEGVYSWQIRAFDKLERPGLWSAHHPVVVMPSAPQTDVAENVKEKNTYSNETNLNFHWKSVKEAHKYQFELKKDGKTVLKQELQDTHIEVPSLPTGEYSWSVKSVIQAGSRTPASLPTQQWESQSTSQKVAVIHRVLDSPQLTYPVQVTLEPNAKDQKQKFEWKKVDGAQSYQLTISKKAVGRNPASEGSPSNHYTVQDNSFEVELAEGEYNWSVRAMAEPDSKSGSTPMSALSQATFGLERQSSFKEKTGDIELSTLIANYNYQSLSGLHNASGQASSSESSVRLGGNYWYSRNWGVGVGVVSNNYSINGSSYSETNFEALSKYRLSLTPGQTGWNLNLNAGIASQQYNMVTAFVSRGPASISNIAPDSYSLRAIGPTLGFALNKQFTDKWRASLNGSFFSPMMLSGAPSGSSLGGGDTKTNISLGAKLLYWLNQKWDLGVGMLKDQHSIGYHSTETTTQESINMDSTYYFGNLVYHFGD